MELDEAIIGRRSVRIYSDKEIDDKILREVIEAGTWAPSASNKQLWYFIIVNDDETKKQLFELGAAHILLSPVSIFVLYGDPNPNWKYPDDIESASACIQNMLLKAYQLGLGTCWVNCIPKSDIIKKTLNIPKYFKIIAQINIGHPKNIPTPPARKKGLDEMISYNKFDCDYIKPPKKPFIKDNIPNFLPKLKRIRREKTHFGWGGLKKPKDGWPGQKSIDWEDDR